MVIEKRAYRYEGGGLSFTHSPIYGFRGVNGHVSFHLMHYSPENRRLILGRAYFSEECPFNEAVEVANHVFNEWRPTRINGEPEDYNLVIRGNAMYTDFSEIERRLIIYCALRNTVTDFYELMYKVIKMNFLAAMYWGGELLKARDAGYFEYLRLKKALKLVLNL
ncbi:hypothetical protein [Caldivirga sp.]|uniref:hypothetical protein n=1 Tax=Caldivirga sp. TaxID=2080243 RepID=UPI003D0998A3